MCQRVSQMVIVLITKSEDLNSVLRIHGGKRKSASECCPLTSAGTRWNFYNIHTQNKQINNK